MNERNRFNIDQVLAHPVFNSFKDEVFSDVSRKNIELLISYFNLNCQNTQKKELPLIVQRDLLKSKDFFFNKREIRKSQVFAGTEQVKEPVRDFNVDFFDNQPENQKSNLDNLKEKFVEVEDNNNLFLKVSNFNDSKIKRKSIQRFKESQVTNSNPVNDFDPDFKD